MCRIGSHGSGSASLWFLAVNRSIKDRTVSSCAILGLICAGSASVETALLHYGTSLICAGSVSVETALLHYCAIIIWLGCQWFGPFGHRDCYPLEEEQPWTHLESEPYGSLIFYILFPTILHISWLSPLALLPSDYLYAFCLYACMLCGHFGLAGQLTPILVTCVSTDMSGWSHQWCDHSCLQHTTVSLWLSLLQLRLTS